MQVTVKMLMLCSIALYTNGCSSKQECAPIVKMIKPTKINVDEAKIIQCRSSDIMKNTKCVLVNYLSIKKERDQLRSIVDEITE